MHMGMKMILTDRLKHQLSTHLKKNEGKNQTILRLNQDILKNNESEFIYKGERIIIGYLNGYQKTQRKLRFFWYG